MAAPAFPARAQAGFSLIELMVALLLGLLLMSGIIAVYLESKRGFVQDEAISRVQENGRYALRLLSREIAMAGFFGGVTELDKITSPGVTDCPTWLLNPDEVIEVYDYADSSATSAFGSCLTGATITGGTDILAVRRASDAPLIQEGEWETGFSSLTGGRYYLHNNASGLGDSSVAIAADIDTSALTAVGSTSDLWAYQGRIYYIGTESGGVPSLCVRSVETPTQTCLVNGVESLQLELGVDTDGDGIPDEFISDEVADVAGAVDADTVLSMRVHLLVRSLEPVRNFAAESRTWNLGSETLTTNDQFYRRVFTTTVPRNNQVFTTFD
jgi:type IV pilus assembly protein PilW